MTSDITEISAVIKDGNGNTEIGAVIRDGNGNNK